MRLMYLQVVIATLFLCKLGSAQRFRPACRNDEYRCQSGHCIDYIKRCDRKSDCDDGDDEVGCNLPCTASQWQCDYGSCIDRRLRCDGNRDCPEDDSDERSCRDQCAANEFQCARDKTCIPSELRCNRQLDCGDGSDEDRCPHTSCRSDQFRCDDGLCLNINQRCNEVSECYNGEDERGCPSTCRTDQYHCKSGECIDGTDRCNGYPECRDGSDENQDECASVPDATTPPSCGVDDFVCGDGSCVSATGRCDGIHQCPDGADERNCVVCPRGKFRCSDGTCIDEDLRCNKYPECRDRSDEEGCPEECKPREFRCSDSICISDAFRCDGYDDCLDKSDELGCPPRPDVRCTERQFKCGDGRCIDQRSHCDGHVDCDDASDETDCGCQPSEFTCASGDCVPESARCNRRVECRDGSDERNCPPPTPATTPAPPPSPVRCYGQFACRTGGQCVPLSAHCNGRFECQDFSDEDNCRGSTGGLNLKTYPDDQIIKESREVVFQCRDEGPLRARVQWVRAGNLPLPPGSYDNNGRLEMPNIQVEHSGEYVCEAVGHSKSTPGATTTVQLVVEPFAVAPTRPSTACGLQEATCVNGECVDKQMVCDGKFDCSDGSDEMRCNPLGCEPNEFRCSNKKCVLKTWRCDSENDCGDNSDEMNCATLPPGSQCQYHEYECRTGNQCIPKSFHCDLETDCIDGSDEQGCSPVHITVPPPPMIELEVGSVFTITCTAIGVPVPEISWRLNWGHIPAKCVTTSVNGFGKLVCADIQEADQGAYSCEAINNRGSRIGVPDTILVIRKDPTHRVCVPGTFNAEARTRDECIPCFCFGVATDCDSADLFTYQLPPPFDQHKLLSVRAPSGGDIAVGSDFLFGGQQPSVRPVGAQGFHVTARTSEYVDRDQVAYFAVPENFHGNQLKSYGGYLNYTLLYDGSGRPVQAPDVIITGNGYTLVHSRQTPSYAGRPNDFSVRFFYGDWHKRMATGRPGGDIPLQQGETLATRAEIMMALGSVDNILIRSQYISGSTTLDTTVTDIRMDSAGIRNTGQGQAEYVEECRCPSGYSGLSCENCAAGFHRHRAGPWLGQCVREPAPCPSGQYREPRSQQCAQCPCPLTNPSNQFGQTCHLDTDGQVTCDCPPGYVGRRCEQCLAGFQGNPLSPGDYCKRGGQCDARGSKSTELSSTTGSCDCKSNVFGTACNQCKANTFNLDASNQFGCINCFCTGIDGATCTSSNWYRQQVVSSFVRNTQDFKLVDKQNRDEPITDGIRLDTNTREITYQDFSRRSPDVYYWLLPSQFLGDKITSYGGVLNYTIRYVPAPGGASSRNNAPDVELISSNDIKLMYFGRDQLEPDRHQTISVPLLEQYWQRQDGQAANREHLLMALADIEAVLIKATYTTNTREVALSHVSLDIAEERNTGQSRATAVEQCSCPRGYKGLSCHDCDVGFTRGEEGLYLGLCEPCNCNKHSDECHPDTGLCVNCRDNTEGDQCDLCVAGYNGNPTEGGACRREGPPPVTSCDCNVDGSASQICREGQCQCKINVEGIKCDSCRRGCYDLSLANSEGCLQCFCSGVTDSCQSSNLYRTQIPMDLIDSRHGFTLTDSSRRDVITEGMDLDRAKNEIGYRFPDTRVQRLFWSLPPKFTGNQITSYGGNLTVTQRFTAQSGSPTPDQDVIISGNGVTLFWTNSDHLQPNREATFSVPLRESYWTHLDSSGPRPASRADLLTALAGIEAILIRATHATRSQATFLSDVSLDTAVSQYTREGQAKEVEACRCPAEYRGTSCESCAAGHYRDNNDRTTSVFGSCKRCPCNSNEESCAVSPDGRGVVCQCRPQFNGRYCDSFPPEIDTTTHSPVGPPTRPTISITISEPTIQIVEVGSTVRYRCLGQSLITQKPVTLVWSKEGGVLPRDRAIDDLQGLLVITDVRVSDSGSYLCTARDGSSIVTERAVLTVGGSSPPRVTITPRHTTVTEGDPVEFRCEGSGSPAPHLRWIFHSGQLSAESTYRDGVFRIPSARRSDEGTYECSGESTAGTHRAQAVLYIREGPTPPISHAPIVSPQEYTGPGGSDTIRFVCTTNDRAVIRWSRVGGRELPASAVQRDGSLIIYNAAPHDSGIYVCTATSSSTGQVETVQARVTIVNTIGPPTVRIEPDRQTVSQGTLAELRCVASGDPTPAVRWTKVGEEIPRHVQVNGALLRISNVQVNDRGVYVCQAENSGGTGQASAIIEVERREPPSIEMHPESHLVVTAGGSTLIQCRVTGGIPSPKVRWSRPNGRPLTLNVEEVQTGVLRFQHVTADEAGQYTCHAENEAGQVSAVATLEIQSPPVLHLLPGRTVTKSVGDRLRLDCRADGEPTPTVSWRKYIHGQHVMSEGRRSETPQSAVYEVTRLRKEDEGVYICTARNAAGETENRLQLIVEDNASIPAGGDDDDDHSSPYPPFIAPTVSSDQDVFRVPVGGKAEMRCRVRGNRDRIFLNWVRSDNMPMPPGYIIQDGILFIQNVEVSAAGEYSCLGISTSGQTLFTANARLEVIAPPRIALNPTRQVVKPGDHAYITCSATGDQPITIEWSAMGRAFSPRATSNQGYLQFRGIEVSDAGRYVCKATNSAGDAEAAAEVIVSEHQTQPTVTAVQRDQSAQVGASIQLRCMVPSDARSARITWRRDRSELPRSAVVQGSVLELSNVQAVDEGRYVCELRTHEGTSSDYIDLRVEPVKTPTLAIRVQPSQEVVRVGDTVDVRCVASGQSAGNAHISWTKHGDQLETNAQAYGNLLRISDVRPSNGGVYRCTVRTLTGSYTEDYVLAILDDQIQNTDSPPVETRTAPHGSTVMMDCRTDLEAPVTYSWSKQGGSLPKDSDTKQESLTIHAVRGADAGTYVCTAQNGAVKMDIPTVLVVTGVVPHFAQAPNSYMALPTLPDAYLVFAIEVAFKPERGDGLILYNGQQRGGGGDFISLGLNRSYVEFRFNVGSGPALIRSPYPITLGEWHTVKLHRTRKEGAMYVDGEGPIQGMALGRFQGLDLVEPLYIGGVPDFDDVHKLNGFVKGFVGCISQLVIGSVEHDLVHDATFSHGVTSCETCAVNPCRNRGVCQEANQPRGYTCICPASFSGQDCERVGLACYPGSCGPGRCVNRASEGFDCYCPFGRGGPKCQDEIGITEPAFADDAYLAYPTPKAVKRLKMALKVNPKTLDDGILLYCSQSEDGHGDFASLAIRDKRLEFRFDTGSGPAVLRSARDIVPGQWLTVSAGRDLREGHLSVNNDSPVTGRSPGDKRGLNLRTSLYVGGYDKQKVKLASGVGVAKGFQGCISEVKVAGVEMDMFTALVDSANVQDCSAMSSSQGPAACDNEPCRNGGQCTSGTDGHYTCQCPFGFSGHNCEQEWDACLSQRPCQNGGSCVAVHSSYKCNCPLGYAGNHCQNIAELSADVSFLGNGYIELRNSLLPHKDSSESEVIALDFTTSEPDGLIFWHGQEASADGRGQDFLALAVVNGFLEFSYELGSGPALIRAAGQVDDGRRHKVVLKRQGKDGSIELDNGITEFGESGGLLNTLNTRGNIYFGGVENYELMTAGRFAHGLDGCIHRIRFQQSEINVGDNAVAGVNAQPCSNDEDDDDNDISGSDELVH